jgi:hypothetical protein
MAAMQMEMSAATLESGLSRVKAALHIETAA